MGIPSNLVGRCAHPPLSSTLRSSRRGEAHILISLAQNGDALSKIYVGTGAINTSFTRTGKKSLAGLLSDASKRFVPLLLPASFTFFSLEPESLRLRRT